MLLERIVLYWLLGALTMTLGHDLSSAAFWCFLALFWAVDHVSSRSATLETLILCQTTLNRARLMMQQAEQLKIAKGYSKDATD